MMRKKSPIPPFSLIDQDGIIQSSNNFKGKWLIVYFYPKDDTPGCTIEACSFRDEFSLLKEKGVEVIGISKDSSESHKKFADKYHLPFILLSDPKLSTTKAFGAWREKKFMGLKFNGIVRSTFLISPQGYVEKIYHDVNPMNHASKILNDLEKLN